MIPFPSFRSPIPPELQDRFENEVRRAQLQSSLIYTSVALLLSLLFLISDYQFLLEEFNLVAILRLSTVAICLVALWSMRGLSVRSAFWVISLGMLYYNAVVVYLGVLAADHGLYTYQQGTVLLIIYCCTLFQAPMLHSTLIVLGCCVTYLIGIIGFSVTSLPVILNNSFVFITAALLGIMAVMQRERYLAEHFMASIRLKKQQQAARNQALTDALTGLPNRYSIMSYLESYQGRVPANMLIMMIDVDNFKRLNDDLGHPVGDVALQQVADAMSQTVAEEQGYIARYGGEEFLVFLENVSHTRAEKAASALIDTVERIRHEALPPMTISLGAYYTCGQEHSISECIELADRALLDAKQAGKNRYCFAVIDH